ncbi:MAG: tRNA threonylcarbamoyladenosine dehydratase [Treponemataceae bacterium]|nr:tRNA threonylcarbamoyladenosine dehydratase [Treponemataceae bacterium]
MENQFSRTEILLGKDSMEILKNARVAVFGIGGVGGHIVEALVRSGIYNIDIIDKDTVSLTNLNRQIIALHSSIGKYKVDVMKERILDINPEAKVNAYKCFYLPETKDQFDFSKYDYVADAVDTVTAKIQLIVQAKEAGCKIISCMGAGNKVDPNKFEIADISKTSVCPLARVMRQECKKRGIKDVKVLYSKENAIKTENPFPGSTSFVPSVAGLIIASEIIKDLVYLKSK